MDWQRIRRVHMIGVGGIGMSALARIYLAKGIEVSGSDDCQSDLIFQLIAEKVNFLGKIKSRQLSVDLVIYSGAIPENNSELSSARKQGITCWVYAKALGELSEDYHTIAICGTHGKSTTTAMMAKVFADALGDPTVIVGTLVPDLGNKNMCFGHSKYLIIEACEYQRSFLHLLPQTILITNMEADHLDYYRDLADYRSAFNQFIQRLPKTGLIVANNDDLNVQKILENSQLKVIFYSLKNPAAQFYLWQRGIFKNQELIGELNLKLFGPHNYLNALAVLALADQYNLNLKSAVRSLNDFSGTWRRLELLGRINETDIYSDYAHHPTEIRATLTAAREKYGRNRRLIVCFQPHQYNRTKHFFDDFARAFVQADVVIIPNIYQVRDQKADIESVAAEDLVKEVQKYQREVYYGAGLEKTRDFLKQFLKPNDVCIVMGAGDVWKIGNALINGRK